MKSFKADKKAKEADLIKRMDAAFKVKDKISVPPDFNARVWERLGEKPAGLFDRVFFGKFSFTKFAYAAAALIAFIVIYENIGRSDLRVPSTAAVKPAVKSVTAKKEIIAPASGQLAEKEKQEAAAQQAPVTAKKTGALAPVAAVKELLNGRKQELAAGRSGAAPIAAAGGVKIASVPDAKNLQQGKPPAEGAQMSEKYIVMHNIIKPLQGERIIIKYKIATPYNVVVTVFDRNGGQVKKLASGIKEPGIYEASWDGRQENGNPAADGIYMIYMRTDLAEEKIKAMVVK